MWQSKTWIGLNPALQNVLIAGVGIILANLSGSEHLAAETKDSARQVGAGL
jgi:hypothetical protein